MRKSITAAALLAAFGVAGVATAQSSDSLAALYPHGMTVRVGFALPFESGMSDRALGNLGLDYGVRSLFTTGESYISGDIFFPLGRDGATVIPFMINHRMHGTGIEARPYVFFGVGGAVIDRNGTGTTLAGKAGIGHELGRRGIAEAAVIITGEAGGVHGSALTFNVGYRF